jgi:hypothetical protein
MTTTPRPPQDDDAHGRIAYETDTNAWIPWDAPENTEGCRARYRAIAAAVAAAVLRERDAAHTELLAVARALLSVSDELVGLGAIMDQYPDEQRACAAFIAALDRLRRAVEAAERAREA